MRISDWSSDVCSSDLELHLRARPRRQPDPQHRLSADLRALLRPVATDRRTGADDRLPHRPLHGHAAGKAAQPADLPGHHSVLDQPRSEEHTSELQSLMRISYAVFCLKKKTNIRKTNSNTRDKNIVTQ